MKKTIRIHYTHFQESFTPHNHFFTQLLSTRYNVIFDEKKPDFLFHNCFKKRHEKEIFYYNCPKIFYTGENVSPDFNMTDYALGFDLLTLGDRYFRLPLFYLYENTTFTSEKPLERKFCNFLYSNTTAADPFREELFHALSSYKQVDSGGDAFNNIGRKIDDKFLWQQEYKFSIACENSSKPGYTTEKILQALQANTVPIYWGNQLIEEDFSKDCFVNAMDFSSLTELVEYIKFLDQNDDEYLKILNAPWQTHTTLLKDTENKDIPSGLEYEELKNFLFNIFDQEPQLAKRIPKYGFTPNMAAQQAHVFSCSNNFTVTDSIVHKIKYFIKYPRRGFKKIFFGNRHV